MRKTTSFVCLIACTFIWGTTFIAQDTGMDNIGPFTFNSVRFFVGFLVVAPFVFLFERKKINSQFNYKTNHLGEKGEYVDYGFEYNSRSNPVFLSPEEIIDFGA